ncbi:hypothetical protein JS530_10465 [Bifidobacterium sp. LC6]|uniref:Permease n=1 Tax=Bifidobacterium colobi TaxID=2809026 RepID=A0ABS5UXR0_9BIFI|nr:hypothetical protein [Bifidobacterium colobi]MBT1175911.1 hypothetical protein [Bifidobacterium colobi]
MSNNNEDYDFFEGEEYSEPIPDRRGAGARGGRGSGYAGSAAGVHSTGRRATKLKIDSPASKVLRRLALATGLLAVVAGASSATHEIAPYAIPFLTKVPGRYIAATAAVLIGITLMFVIGARATMPRNSTHGGVGGGGIVTIVLASACLVVGVAVGVLFPKGLILPDTDKAPVDSAVQMEQGIEQVAGKCEGGWIGLDTGGIPGVSTVQMCAKPRVAFVSFESETMASVGMAPIQSKISELLDQYSDNANAQGDWKLLTGKRWMVFGESNNISALQQQWGGDIVAIPGTGEGSDSSSADASTDGSTTTAG